MTIKINKKSVIASFLIVIFLRIAIIKYTSKLLHNTSLFQHLHIIFFLFIHFIFANDNKYI